MKTNFKKIAKDGLISSNPTLKLVLGTCPTLALTTMAMNGIGMGLAVTFVLICSNMIISLLRKAIPNEVRIPAFVLIIATFVTIVRLVLDKLLPDIYASLGLYLPLIVVNCIILARAESFASKNGVIASACDGLFMGLGFTCALTLIGAVREILGSGAIFGIKLWNFQIGFFASSAGAFFTYAIFIMAFTAITEASKKRKKLKDYAALEQEKHSEEANAATAEIKNSTDNKEAE
jgi:electron transport complex, rnfABCDGE type, E subunit